VAVRCDRMLCRDWHFGRKISLVSDNVVTVVGEKSAK
jgi:hypothetical protein